MIKKITLPLALSVLTLTAQAQANQTPNQDDKTGFAILADIGAGHQKLDVSGGYKSESGNSFSAAIGLEYKINSEFSVVLQYADYGEAELFDSNVPIVGQNVGVDFSTESTGLSLVGQYMTERQIEQWSFGGKLGLISWDTDMFVEAKANNRSAKVAFGTDDGTDIFGGLIAAYAINEEMDVYFNADWFVSDVDGEIIEGETSEILRARYSVGLKYHF